MHQHSQRQVLQGYNSDRNKENLYLDRIANLMDTNRKTLDSYAKIKLWEDGPNYQKVVKYVNNSQCHPNIKLTVVNIHRIWVRNGEGEDLFHIPNRHLLWHGTKRANIPHILNNGFKLPTNAGQMFGSGIYFADRITKSSNYSDLDVTFLLLCEVGMGKIYSCKRPHNDWRSPPVGFDSVKANGTYVPDWTESDRYYGAQIPFGQTAKCTKYSSHAVNFNEFIVYDPSRIIIRFLVEVKVEKMIVPLPLKLVTPVVSMNKTSKNSTNKKTGISTIKTTSLNSTSVHTKSNNLRSSYTASATKPKLTLPSSNVAPSKYATANTIARSNNLRSSYSTSATKPKLTLSSSNAAPSQYATANTIARSNNLRSTYSTSTTMPSFTLPSSNAAPSQYATANTIARSNNLRSTYSTTTTMPSFTLSSSNAAPSQYATANTIARNDSLRSSYSTYATKPTSAYNTYPYEPFNSGYTGYSTNTSSVSRIPIHQAQQEKKPSTCVIL